MTLTDFPAVQALSTKEKLQFVDDLWLNVAPDLEVLEVSPQEKKMLDERWEAYLRNPSSALTIDQLQERVDALRA